MHTISFQTFFVLAFKIVSMLLQYILCIFMISGSNEQSTTLTKMGIKTVPHSPDLAPCDFCLFPKLRGCRYKTSEEIKEAVTKVIDTLTQEEFHGAFQKLLERYKCIAAGGNYFEGN